MHSACTKLINVETVAWVKPDHASLLSQYLAPCRRAMLHHVLMPVLRFAPLAFQISALQERAPKLRDILSRSAASAPALM